MLRKLLFYSVTLLFANVVAFGQSAGTLKGKIVDKETKEPIPFANVIVESGGQQIGGTTTDFDGIYTIKPVPAGKVDVKATYVGYQTQVIAGVIISPNKISVADVELSSTMEQLDVVVVTAYKVPLIEADQTSGGGTVTSEEIAKMPGRDALSVAATVGGISKEEGSGDLNIRGSRAEGAVTYIDGVRVRGSSGVPKSAVDQVNVITGGLPAKYGDATGGVVNITTKGPSREFGAGLEIVTSEFLDKWGYNLGAFNINGPLVSAKGDNDTKNTIVGFFISGEASSIKDEVPFAGGRYYYKLNSEKQDLVETQPLTFNNLGTIYQTNLLRLDDFEKIDRKQNAENTHISLSSKFDIKPKDANFYFTLGGSMDYSKGNQYIQSYSLLNSDNNPEVIENTYRGYARFTHRFNDQAGDSAKSTIKNVYYTIQADFEHYDYTRQQEGKEDKFMEYGYVGKFTPYKSDNYEALRNKSYYTYDAAGNIIDTLKFANVYEYTGLRYDSILFTSSDINPILSNYNEQFYEIYERFPTAYENFITMSSLGALLNGDQPYSTYGLWSSPGTLWNGYETYNRNQVSVSLDGSADIGKHELMFGARFEKRTDRGYVVNDPSGLWTQMRSLANKHINQLSSEWEFQMLDVDNDGIADSTIHYDYTYDASQQSRFDFNLRQKLGLSTTGTDFIDIDSYSPDMFDIDMFSADELLNDGYSYVTYYGYDYKGDKLSSKPSFDDFFTGTDENGDFTRNIGAFEPVYMSGYIQDKFDLKDLIFRIGLRVDRFDANQYVLKDPYTLFESYTIGEVTQLGNTDVSHPSNLSDDAVIYVNDYTNPTSIIAYRDENTWYNTQGVQIDDLATIRTLDPKPYVKNPAEVGEHPLATAFEDYEPQTTLMPRIAFSFPISDVANFYFHYDVVTQRPLSDNRFNITDYYYIFNRATSNNIFDNPNLKPERTIDYALGFQQKVNETSAIKFEVYYKEFRDQRQAYYYVGAFPKPYYSYINQDFGTTKGFILSYDLRRTGNVWMKANYTLQFAEGTGSDETSSLGLLRANQPNLRTIVPLNFDNRHGVNVILDYSYGEGKEYNGPVIGNAQILKNTGLNVTLSATSGKPYSKNAEINSVYIAGLGTTNLDGSLNGSRMPWSFLMNAKLSRDIAFKMTSKKDAYLNLYIEALNLMNLMNIKNVYSGTGDPDDDGVLYDSKTQNYIDSQIDELSFRDLYYLRMRTPYNYGLPRRIRFGVALSF